MTTMLLPAYANYSFPTSGDAPLANFTRLPPAVSISPRREGTITIVGVCHPFTPAWRRICDAQRANMEYYARSHGYGLLLWDVNNAHPRHVLWSKIPALRHALETVTTEFVWWQDADSLFVDRTRSLESLKPRGGGKDLTISGDHTCFINSVCARQHELASRDRSRCRSVLVRVCVCRRDASRTPSRIGAGSQFWPHHRMTVLHRPPHAGTSHAAQQCLEQTLRRARVDDQSAPRPHLLAGAGGDRIPSRRLASAVPSIGHPERLLRRARSAETRRRHGRHGRHSQLEPPSGPSRPTRWRTHRVHLDPPHLRARDRAPVAAFLCFLPRNAMHIQLIASHVPHVCPKSTCGSRKRCTRIRPPSARARTSSSTLRAGRRANARACAATTGRPGWLRT